MFQFFKVVALPNNPRPNAFYYVLGDDDWSYTDAYLTDKDGVAKRVTNKAIIEEIVNENLDTTVRPIVVPDIDARNQLTLTSSQLVFVEDASDDPQVSNGDATYLWNPNNSTYNLVSGTEMENTVLDGGNF